MSLYLRCWKPFMTTASHSCYLNCCHHRFKLFCCPVSFCWNFTSKIYFPFNSSLSMINKSISHIYIWVCFLFSLYLDLFTMAIIRFCIYKSKKYKNTKRYVFIFQYVKTRWCNGLLHSLKLISEMFVFMIQLHK